MDALQILVVILSVTLAFFLLVSIILIISLIRIAKQISRVTSSVERTAGQVESIVSSAQAAVAPAMWTKAITGMIKKFADRGNSDK